MEIAGRAGGLVPTNKIRKAAVQNLLHWIKQRMQPAPPWAQ